MLSAGIFCAALAVCSLSALVTCKNMPPPQHYRVVAVADGMGLVSPNPEGGSDKPFSGGFVDLLDGLAEAANFTYEITAQPDGQYGKKDKKTGKWNGMIGSLLEGKADIAVANWGEAPELKEVVDFGTVIDDFPAYILFNPKFGTDGVQYLTREGLELYLIKKSANPRAKPIYQNIKAKKPTSIVKTVEDAAKQIASGKFAFIGDEDSVDNMVDFYNGTLAKDPNPIDTGVPVAAFAAKKGSKIGKELVTLMQAVMMATKEDDLFAAVSDNVAK